MELVRSSSMENQFFLFQPAFLIIFRPPIEMSMDQRKIADKILPQKSITDIQIVLDVFQLKCLSFK